jgi:phosphoglycolate phosphatase
MLLEIMDELGMTADDTLMVGDTTHDLAMARNARVSALAVAFGAHAREDLVAESPIGCVDTVPALRAWIAANG